MDKIAILSIHGIGDQKAGYSDDFHKKLGQNFKNCEVKFFEFYWQHLLNDHENYLKRYLNDLGWRFSRKIAIEYAGDAISYAKDSVFYKKLHTDLDKKLLEIEKWLDGGKLCIIAHSLGSVIIFDYIYSIQNPATKSNTLFKATAVNAISSLEHLVTLGSPLFIYSLQKRDGGFPIRVKNWLNIYSPYDVIGFPVKKINKFFYQDKNIIDKSIICGNLFTFWNPFSHLAYFNSFNVRRIISQFIVNK
jgi:hypothetical protein